MSVRTILIAGFVSCAAALSAAPAPINDPGASAVGARGTTVLPETDREAEVPLLERTAQADAHIEKPGSEYEITLEIERCFAFQLSIEPLPEQCAGALATDVFPDAFSVVKGEPLREVMARLEMASAGRWIFETIQGVPLLRPNDTVEGHGTLLGTVIDVEIEAKNLWDALCELALAVNRKNAVNTSGQRPMMIMFLAPSLMRHPPKIFLEEKLIQVSIADAPAREGLCAILAAVDKNARYYYTCMAEGTAPAYDYVTVTAFDDEGKPLRGGKIDGDEYGTLLESVDWMSDKKILAVQAPGYVPEGK